MINWPSTARVTKVTEFEPEFGGGTAPAGSRRSLSGGAEAQESAAGSAGKTAGDNQPRIGPAVQVLADRLAMALMNHEPGWRLPRHTVLARRYNVSPSEIDAAISELAHRYLVRRLPDGQVHRISPAEYLIPLEGVPGLRSRTDPMAAELACRRRRASWRVVPEDICRALHVGAGEQVYVVHSVWVAGSQPAAYATTYVPADIAGTISDSATADEADEPASAERASEHPDVSPDEEMGEPDGARAPPPYPRVPAADSGVLPGQPTAYSATLAAAASRSSLPSQRPDLPGAHRSGSAMTGSAAALYVEMRPPPPSVARRLQLSPGQPAAVVTVRFDDPVTGRPAALTVTVLRPELFRIVVHTTEMPLPDNEQGRTAGIWARTAETWEL
jgi:DNA-binding GntR family transcriptional regulator